MHEKLEKAKVIIKNNWKPFTVGVVLTGVTLIVTKQFTMRYVRVGGTYRFVSRTVANEGPLYKVFNIYSPGFKNRGPSWMIRCKENGKVFRSQEFASVKMGLSEKHISTHLNGGRDHVAGYHFERIGIAA